MQIEAGLECGLDIGRRCVTRQRDRNHLFSRLQTAQPTHERITILFRHPDVGHQDIEVFTRLPELRERGANRSRRR